MSKQTCYLFVEVFASWFLLSSTQTHFLSLRTLSLSVMWEDRRAWTTENGDGGPLSWPLGGQVVAWGFFSATWMPSPGSLHLETSGADDN